MRLNSKLVPIPSTRPAWERSEPLVGKPLLKKSWSSADLLDKTKPGDPCADKDMLAFLRLEAPRFEYDAAGKITSVDVGAMATPPVVNGRLVRPLEHRVKLSQDEARRLFPAPLGVQERGDEAL